MRFFVAGNILNPQLAVRLKDEWIDIYSLADIGLLSGLDSESGKTLRNTIKALMSGEEVFTQTASF